MLIPIEGETFEEQAASLYEGMEDVGLSVFNCLRNVSYTHLDVYKRQIIDGEVKTHYDGDYNTWYNYDSFAIGFLAYDRESSERVAKSVPGPLNPFF